jgi:hypothetical protein
MCARFVLGIAVRSNCPPCRGGSARQGSTPGACAAGAAARSVVASMMSSRLWRSPGSAKEEAVAVPVENVDVGGQWITADRTTSESVIHRQAHAKLGAASRPVAG